MLKGICLILKQLVWCHSLKALLKWFLCDLTDNSAGVLRCLFFSPIIQAVLGGAQTALLMYLAKASFQRWITNSPGAPSQIISPAIYLCVFLTAIPTAAINPDNHSPESKLYSAGSICLFFQDLQIPGEKKTTKRKHHCPSEAHLGWQWWHSFPCWFFLQSCSTCAQVWVPWVGYWSHTSEKTVWFEQIMLGQKPLWMTLISDSWKMNSFGKWDLLPPWPQEWSFLQKGPVKIPSRVFTEPCPQNCSSLHWITTKEYSWEWS